MVLDLEKEFVEKHKTEEVIAWVVLELGRAKLELSSNPDSLIAHGKYESQAQSIYKVLQALNEKLSPKTKFVA